MKYKDLSQIWIERIPEGTELYRRFEEANYVSQDDGSYVFFGMVVNPFLQEIVRKEDRYLISKAFSLLEEFAESEDIKIREVLDYSILEPVTDGDDEELLNKYMQYMGKTTMQRCIALEKFYENNQR